MESPIFHLKWERKALYRKQAHTRTRTCVHTHIHYDTHTHTDCGRDKDLIEFLKYFWKKMSFEGGSKGRRWSSDGAVEVGGSKQRGLHKKKIFHQMFSCSRGEWRRYECEMQSVVVELACRVEGNQRYRGAVPARELKQNVEIWYWRRGAIGSQCQVWRMGWIWLDFFALQLHPSLAAAFWDFWRLSSKCIGRPVTCE